MKDLLTKVLIENCYVGNRTASIDRLEAVRKYISLLKALKLKGEVVALLSTNNRLQEIFQFACILQGVHYIVLNRTDIDMFPLVNLNIQILFYDSSETEYLPMEFMYNTPVVVLIDALTCGIQRVSDMDSDTMSQIERNFNKELNFEFDYNNETANSLLKIFRSKYVKEHIYSTIFVQHPGTSTFGSKISVFHSQAIENGALKVIEMLYYEIRSKKLLSTTPYINLLNAESVAYPYVLLNSVFLALFSNGNIFNLQSSTEEDFSSQVNTIFISVQRLNILFNTIIDNSYILSSLSSRNILFKLLFKYLFNRRFKNLQLIIFYGKTDRRLRRLLNYTGKNLIYMYTMIEVASFLGFETYKKLPINEVPSVGIIPNSVLINASNNEGEILVDTSDRFTAYTNVEFTNLCKMSEKYVGMHGTLDIGKNNNGKLTVLGKADELFTNEHGLLIQTELIKSIALDNRYIKDCLVVVYSNRLLLLVELKISVLLSEEKTKEDVELILSTSLLQKINKKVQPYSRIDRVVVIPGGFDRGTDGNIKHVNYTIKSINSIGN